MDKHVIKEIDGTDTLLVYIPNILEKSFYNKIKYEVDNYTDWYSGYNYNNNALTRKQKWYQTNGLSFCKDWKVTYDRWTSFDYSNNLLELQDIINSKVNNVIHGYNGIEPINYNSLLINYYEDENNFITAHKVSTVTRI